MARFRGAEYHGTDPMVRPVPGRRLGKAELRPCDEGAPWRMAVAALRGVDPRIAVVSAHGDELLIRDDVEKYPPELRRYLEAPKCDEADAPIELRGPWLGILGADGKTELDLKPPYDIEMIVKEASAADYERAQLTIRVPSSLGTPISRDDVRSSLWKGGSIRMLAECADGRFIAKNVQAFR